MMEFYLNFKEDTGEIWKATNELDDSTPYIQVDVETYRLFTSEQRRLSDYVIIPSTDKKSKWEIQFRHKDLNDFDVDKSIHHIEKSDSLDTQDAVFGVIQNAKAGTWKISLTDDLKERLTSTLYYKDKTQLMYVTKKDNPNILLDTLVIKLYNVIYDTDYLVENINSEVAKMENVSIYCGKVFDRYQHVLEG